jgi:hypothetical protein
VDRKDRGVPLFHENGDRLKVRIRPGQYQSHCAASSQILSVVFLAPPLRHAQDLHHPDEDVEEVQLQTDTLVHHILPHHSPLGHPRMLQNLLDVVQRKAAKHGEPAVQPDLLAPHQCPGGGGGEDQGCETRESDDGHASQQGAAEVEVFFLFGGRADKGDRTHHANGVNSGAGEKGRGEQHEGGKDGGLGYVEAGPEGVLLHVAGEKRRISP